MHQATLQSLKNELEFLDRGGYRRSPRSPWRMRYIFEESPSCPNFSDRTRQHRCIDCWLMEFVAPDRRTDQSPCRFVQLTPPGVTVDSLYRCGTPEETEDELRRWLHGRIRELEDQTRESQKLLLP
jgi:hypothetical protein